MARDFYNAFGQGRYGMIGNDKTINQTDMMGVTFIAVQGLIKENDFLKAHLQSP